LVRGPFSENFFGNGVFPFKNPPPSGRLRAMTLVHLHLRAPIEYDRAPLVPFAGLFPAEDRTREFVFCFELDREQAARIDPDPAAFPGELLFAGRRDAGLTGDPSPELSPRKPRLPQGPYAFVQERRELDRGECVGLAIEQQKDGLWERLRMGNLLYIRFLFEDGSPVTQLFRPLVPS